MSVVMDVRASVGTCIYVYVDQRKQPESEMRPESASAPRAGGDLLAFGEVKFAPSPWSGD